MTLLAALFGFMIAASAHVRKASQVLPWQSYRFLFSCVGLRDPGSLGASRGRY
jgi:hypothetical protein